MAWSPKWGDGYRGWGIWETTWGEKLEPRTFQFPNPRGLMGREGGLGSSEEWQDRTKSKECSQRWKVGMLKGSSGRRQILNQHILLQSKSQRMLGECVHSLLSPKTVRGGFFKKLWPLSPRYPLTSNHKISKERPGADHLWINHKPLDLSPAPHFSLPLLVTF